ncbi:flagellar motor switch protein FliN [Sulfobacillus harzensis]|uniref:Flagellar motor switch protein FliN n=1 Tax=Sulfobacillus harzensis TaxID=2729629 RepID=A0A7Y0L4C4_9FIRM|nr:flagellar motor switch protein FliN [Sulfobacillus harzensis]NMP23078.1 flagellar motor switch protein FliN [Sulfobacillus harzensis]
MAKKAARLTAEEIQALVDASDTSEAAAEDAVVEVKKVEFSELDDPGTGSTRPGSGSESVEFLWDVPLTVEVVLGSTEVTVKDVLEVGPGSVIELDRAYGEPVDLYLNGRLVARGDVVIIGEQFGVKITEILVTGEEMGSLSQNP